MPTHWGYNGTQGAGYQIVTGLCALVKTIHKACAFVMHATADDDTHISIFETL